MYSRVDAVCAVQIMSDSAKMSLPTLRELQNLARGAAPPIFAESSCGSKEGRIYIIYIYIYGAA